MPFGKLTKASLIGAVTLLTAGQAPVWAADHPNLSGFWGTRAGSVKRGDRPQYTDTAQEELKKPNKNTDPNGVDENDRNCLPYGQPWNLYQSSPTDIVQDDRETTMIYEDRSIPWHIYTDGRQHPAKLSPTFNGHSIGRWEGDEFVVDTVGFAQRVAHGALMVLPNNETTHIVMRLKLSADGNELHGHFKTEDPKWLTKPYEMDVTWYRNSGDEYAVPVICDARDLANSRY